MIDLGRGSRTRLTLEKLQYNVPLKDEDFTLQAIRRAIRRYSFLITPILI